MRIEEEIKKFKIDLIRKMPFYGDIIMRLSITPSKRNDTACTDGRNIYYNPDFFENLKAGEINFVLMHEVFHILLRHCRRSKDKNHYYWNIACDMVVNNMLSKLEYDMRQASIQFEAPKEGIFEKLSDFDIVENVYERIRKLNGDGETNEKTKIKVLVKRYAWSNGEIYTVEGNGDLIIKELSGEWDSETADIEKFDVDDIFVREIIKEALNKNRASLGSYFIPKETFALTESKKIKWEVLLRNFLQDEIDEETSYLTPERKYIHMDLIVPGYGTNQEKLDELWAFIDSSGSVGKNELEQFLTQLYRISHEFEATINICYWDTKVTDIYLKIQNEKDIIKCVPEHSGGTDINCVYDWIRDNKIKPEVMLILTDGYFGKLETSAFLPKYGKKTVLVLSSDITENEDMKRIGKITRL